MKQTVDYKYLNFIALTNFDLWDVKRYTSRGITSVFPIVDLGSCIQEENKKHKLSEQPEKEFGILGVNNKEGIFDAYHQNGKDIKQAYKKMKIGWIAYNPYRINVGSIGVRLEEHKNEYISPAYVVFSCLKNLSPEFLFLLFKTERLNKIINESTTGSVRQNLTVDTLKKLQIPLPSFAEQEAIIKAYQTKIQQAQDLEQQAQDLEQEVEKYFLNELGIEKKEEADSIKKGLQIFQFKDLDRWDIWVNKNQIFGDKYKPIKFGDIVLGKPTYGANVKGVKKKSDTRYIRITDINDNGTLNKEFVSPQFVEEKYLLKENDFLIARSGTVGKTFLFKEKYGRAIYAGYLVRYRLDSDIVLPEYIFVYTKSYLFKQWVISNQRVAGQPNINGQEYLQAPIIVPPLDIQQNIVNKIGLFNKQKQKFCSQIETLKYQAKQEFEQAIFD